ncbi:ACTB [Symbiodinium natans]|uniref:ACTB protein n=1 Tax=Symbiodinium natans TaxID=878477 RepID=A0A812IAX2_9DINO|nr:ACTB [Symbiodinium natans]
MSDDLPAIIVDNGTFQIKAGFAGDDLPRAICRCVVGHPKEGGDDYLVGENAEEKSASMNLKHPLERGFVYNWEDMMKVWSHVFYNELRVTVEEHPVIMTEPPLNPKEHREYLTSLMFESWNVPAFYVATPAVLCLYASGRTTGLVVQSGDSISHVVPVIEGCMLADGVVPFEIAGNDLTDFMEKLLAQRGYAESDYGFQTLAGRKVVRDVKEKLCRVANDLGRAMEEYDASPEPRTYCHPDPRLDMALGTECYRCPEALFNPVLISKEGPSMHLAILHAIERVDPGFKKDLWSNVILSGGNTMFPGLPDRLLKELGELVPEMKDHIKVVASPERRYLPWVGASVLTSLGSFEDMWVTRADYDAEGPTAVRKCR